MRDAARKVGIGRLVRLDWLEETASLVLAGNDQQAVHDALDGLLADQISRGGNAPRSGREKAITVLIKTWLLVPAGLEPLRDAGLDLLRDARRGDRLAVHWGMLLAAYPFWGAVAARVGRQFRLDGHATAAGVQTRIREEYGERPGVERATRYVLRSFVDWGAIRESGRPGIYDPMSEHSIGDPTLASFLLEAVLRGRGLQSATPSTLLTSPRLFPFRIEATSAETLAAASSRLQFVRHGLDQELLTLRRSAAPQAPNVSITDTLFARDARFAPTDGGEPGHLSTRHTGATLTGAHDARRGAPPPEPTHRRSSRGAPLRIASEREHDD